MSIHSVDGYLPEDSISKSCMDFIPGRVLTRRLAMQKSAEAECAPANMSEDSAN